MAGQRRRAAQEKNEEDQMAGTESLGGSFCFSRESERVSSGAADNGLRDAGIRQGLRLGTVLRDANIWGVIFGKQRCAN